MHRWSCCMIMEIRKTAVEEQEILHKNTSRRKPANLVSGLERPRNHDAELFLVAGEVFRERFRRDHHL